MNSNVYAVIIEKIITIYIEANNGNEALDKAKHMNQSEIESSQSNIEYTVIDAIQMKSIN